MSVTKPCADCKEPVEDIPVDDFTGDWLCYWCHCSRKGIDHKTRLNSFATAMKLGLLVRKDLN